MVLCGPICCKSRWGVFYLFKTYAFVYALQNFSDFSNTFLRCVRERTHLKNLHIKRYPEKLKECGVLAYPLDYMSPKIPGLGDVNWSAFISALNDIQFNGCAVIEVEDKEFEGSREDILNSIRLSKRYLDIFII